jgi:hypothetical protein
MATSAEKLVKQTIKVISKAHGIDYEELKMDTKKLIKAARSFDETLLGMMEEIMELGNVGSQEELEEFNPEVLKIYCRIKELDESGSDSSLRARVWRHIEEEFELDSEEESDEESEEESESEVEQEPEPEPEPETKKKRSKKVVEKEVIVIG